MAGGAPSVRHGCHHADLTILTGRNLPKIRQSREPEPSTVNEKTIADFTRVVEETGDFGARRGSYERGRQLRAASCNTRPCHSLESAGRAPSRKSRTRSNRPQGVSAAYRSPCSHRRTGKRRWASFRRPGAGRPDKSGLIPVAFRYGSGPIVHGPIKCSRETLAQLRRPYCFCSG